MHAAVGDTSPLRLRYLVTPSMIGGQRNPFSGAVIVYRAKRSDRLKILVWDRIGV